MSARTADTGLVDEADLLYGAAAIAAFLRIELAQARYLIAGGRLPTFKLNGARIICARKSTLRSSIAAQEASASRTVAAA